MAFYSSYYIERKVMDWNGMEWKGMEEVYAVHLGGIDMETK